MALTPDDLRDEVGAGSGVSDAKLQSYLDDAEQAVDDYTVDKLVEEIPANVLDRAILRTAAEMFHQDKAPSGVLNQVYDTGDGYTSSTPVRIGSDPLRPAYPILARYMPAAMIG